MNLIRKWWIKLLISILGGGILSKFIASTTDYKLEISPILITIILYAVLAYGTPYPNNQEQ